MNIDNFPELVNPLDEDWILIQPNDIVPAYKKAKLVNVRGSGNSSPGNTVSWIYRDGSTDFNISSGGKYLIDTPGDVTVNLGNLPDGSEIEIKRSSAENFLYLTGVSKIDGNDIDSSTSIKVSFSNTSSRLIYLNPVFGWFFIPKSSFIISSSLNLPTDGLIQLFNAANIANVNNGGQVPQWIDEISNQNATQNNIGYQPSFAENIFKDGTSPGLLFIGNQEYETDISYLANQKYTIAIVEARNDSQQLYIFGSSNGNTNTGLHLGYRGDNSFTLAQYGNDLDSAIESYSNSPTPILWVVSNNSRGKEIYRNGVLVESNNNTDNLTEANNGRIGSALGSYYRGYLGLIATWIGDKTKNEITEINSAINSSFGNTFMSYCENKKSATVIYNFKDSEEKRFIAKEQDLPIEVLEEKVKIQSRISSSFEQGYNGYDPGSYAFVIDAPSEIPSDADVEIYLISGIWDDYGGVGSYSTGYGIVKSYDGEPLLIW